MSSNSGVLADVRVRFGRRERRGVILGLKWSQVIVLGSVVLVGVVLLIAGQTALLGALAPALVLVAVIGAGRFRREPILVFVVHMARFWRASATSQWAALGEVGSIRTGKFALAGGLGSIDLHETTGGLGFSYDRARRQFAFTVTMTSAAWPLLDEGSQSQAVGGFVAWMNGLTRVPGLVVADVRLRSDFSSSTAVEDYTTTQIAARHRREAAPCSHCGIPVSSAFCYQCGTPSAARPAWGDEQSLAAAASVANASMEFSYEITFAFALTALRDRAFAARVNRAGGGIDGAGQVLELEAATLMRSLTKAGVTDVRWLSSKELMWACRLAYDPETAVARKRVGGFEYSAVPEAARPMAAVRRWDHLRIDEVFHQVFWIADWPTTDVPVGFLEEVVVNAGDFTRCVTLQLVPVSKDKALRAVNAAQTDLDAAEGIREKLGQRTTGEQKAEAADVQEREDDLSEGFREMEFRGYITITAPTREELDVARNGIEVACQQAQVEPKVMWFQQAEAFNTAVLPFGLGASK